MIGHASDDIRLTAEVSFETKKQLPLNVSMSTTIGELMRDARTAPVLQKLFSGSQSGVFGKMIASKDDSAKAMAKAMLDGMPIKSLISFGMMTPEQVEGFIGQMQQVLN